MEKHSKSNATLLGLNVRGDIRIGGRNVDGTGNTLAFAFFAQRLTLFDTNGITPLVTIDNTGQGASESLEDFNLLDPGEYFARVTGADDTIQLYQLDLSISPLAFLEADFNEDFFVDASDLSVFENAFGLSAAGDTNNDGDTDGADFLLWQRQFSGPGGPEMVALQAIPEPTSVALMWLMLLGLAMSLDSNRVSVVG